MEKSFKRIQTGRLSLIMMIIFTFVSAIAWLFGSLYIFSPLIENSNNIPKLLKNRG